MPFRMKKRQEGKLNKNGSLKGDSTGLMDFIQLFMGTKFWGYTFLAYNSKGYDGCFHRITEYFGLDLSR